MIVRKLSLFSTFQITDLPASAVQLVPRCIAAAVFGVPCVGGQEPLAADFAFLRCMTNTQALKEIRPEHPHKGYIVHPLDQLRQAWGSMPDARKLRYSVGAEIKMMNNEQTELLKKALEAVIHLYEEDSKKKK